MTTLAIISEVFLYTSFSLLFGFFLLHLIPETKRPEIVFPKWLRLGLILGISVFSAVPVLRLVFYVAGDNNVFPVLLSVVTTFEVGKMWLYTAIVAILLLIQNFAPNLEKKKPLVMFSMAYLLALALLLGWASHASALTGFLGFVNHSIHFIALTSWAGILLVVSLFSKGNKGWLEPFLNWFTPFAICCVAIGIATGILIMDLHMSLTDYAQIWLIPYGQALVIKHLLIIPLLVFAFINGFLIKRLIKNTEVSKALSWMKAEGIIILFIFIATGILGQQSPPHNFADLIATEGPSRLMEWIYSGQISPDMKVMLHFQWSSMVLALVAAVCLMFMVILFKKKRSSYLAVLLGSVSVITSYLSFMLSVQ